MKIRPAKPTDFSDIVDIDQSFPDAFKPETIKNGPTEHERWFVLEGYNKALGYIFIDMTSPPPEITNFAVHRDWQNGGWGRKLFDHALKRIRTERPNAHRVRLKVNETNARAIRFYRAAGFDKVGVLPDFYGKGVKAYVMEGPL